MSPPNKLTRVTAVALAASVAGAGFAVAAHGHDKPAGGQGTGIQLENLDRGLVAARTEDGVFLSWRLLADEVSGYNDSGLTGADFNVYRDGELIASVSDSTNYLDAEGEDAEYQVVAMVDGEEVDFSDTVSPWSESYIDIPMEKPADGVTPAGEAYSYRANDISVGDLTGDGRYEYVVKWDPTNSKDVSQVGYTGPVYLDAYTLEGELLWRIDLGVNIRAGAHYTQFDVYDFDGDGVSEIMMKTAPGTKTTSYAADEESFITLPEDDVDAGVTHEDDYVYSAEDYYDHLVGVFLGWHEHPEVVNGDWPATIEAALGADDEFDFEYPLSQEDAESLADHFIDVYAPSRSGRNQLRDFEGFVISGPEYLTVFDGATGLEMDTIDYPVERGDDGLLWGDYAMSRIEPGNRVDRFLSAVAYLDGEHASAIFARGYYTRTTIAAIDWDGKELSLRWLADSGHAPLSNPFNDGPHGVEGPDPEWGTLTTQGNHSLGAADVDGDGKQEIIYGAAALDDDGSLLYSSYAYGPEGSNVEGEYVKLGHGDAHHLGDLDPSREGLEIFSVFEGGPWAPYGYAMRDAATGEVLWGDYSGRDTGRGMAGDIDPEIEGLEVWASLPPGQDGNPEGLFTASGDPIEGATPGTNMSIRWSGDLTTQIISGAATDVLETPKISDWQDGVVLEATGTLTNNWTKGNPGLVADVFGDWREEMLVRTEDSSAVRVYLSTEVTDHKLYTLMHDPQYRVGVATQQTTYNQPQYTSFYMASDMDFADVAVPDFHAPGTLDELKGTLKSYKGDLARWEYFVLHAKLATAEWHLEKGKASQAIRFLEGFAAMADRVDGEPGPVLAHQARQLIEQLR
ncbi:rhamnogalacturonan lyase [Glycomyces sp. L485]|uniref:rhamnogalacturonan lyase n=1 Tax=Glycomyces sp. L485 TaxID=2909235 RepID=UPI001F4A34EB|nr:rhamnogalacturonan lyase [Glycomyces sp. L485]MCH7229886.1 rhamnogalacturonan lyase [Glycomyces sp. L485]